jgi:hypothetical protein
LEAQPEYQLEAFDDLRIDDTSLTLVKAGLNLDRLEGVVVESTGVSPSIHSV